MYLEITKKHNNVFNLLILYQKFFKKSKKEAVGGLPTASKK